MSTQQLLDTVKKLFADDKGILAMDESAHTCNEHFSTVGVPQTEAARRDWRELIITTSGLAESISGVILYDETIRQQKLDGTPFIQLLKDADILIGIKVDTGAKAMIGNPSETITEGLDGLPERLAEYAQLGARFAKWRAVFHLGIGLPSQACIDANCIALANYAKLCHQAGLVPIVEPEILMEGTHTQAECYSATEKVLSNLFQQLDREHVSLDAVILKPNMVLAGLTCPQQITIAEVSEATLQCLRQKVPATVGGIVFLSGGQSPHLASARLNQMEIQQHKSPLPWPLGFSFARALQQPALTIWHGNPANKSAAQHALLHRAKCDRAARRGEYTVQMERL